MRTLLTYKSAAAILDCSPSTVQKMCLAGEIPIIKIGNETRIDPEDLESWQQCRKHFHKPKKRSDSNGKQPSTTTEGANVGSK